MAHIDGDDGPNTIYGVPGEYNTIYGYGGHDTLTGGDLGNLIYGHSGDDRIFGGADNDIIVPGSGRDRAEGGGGDDIFDLADGNGAGDRNEVYGGAGNDFFYPGLGEDVMDGGDGEDTVDYRFLVDGVSVSLLAGTTFGSPGFVDTLTGIEHLGGTAAADILAGDDGVNRISGGDGNDLIMGDGGGDILDGGPGFDTLVYLTSPKGVRVDLASGQVRGGDAEGDTFSGFEDMIGSRHADRLWGDAGGNFINGRNGADRLYGRGDEDSLFGGPGADLLHGGAGDDLLNGGQGADRLIGGLGSDRLEGRGGADRFEFRSVAESPAGGGSSPDAIMDFVRRQGDLIVLTRIDADTTAAGNQAFDYIGFGRFSGTAGELRARAIEDGVRLVGDIDGDRVADLAVDVVGVGRVRADDLLA